MSTIVLTASGNFWGEVSDTKRVLKWIIKDKIEVIKYYDDRYITSAGDMGKKETIVRIRMPLIVMLLTHFGHKAKTERIPFSHEAVYRRDKNICQYWHEYKFDENGVQIPCKPYKYECTVLDRTIDHVVPTSRGGDNSFKNTVCSCSHCNNKIKKNHTPEEAGMKLIREPFVPTRKIGEFVIHNFAYNPKKLSHRVYREIFKSKSRR